MGVLSCGATLSGLGHADSASVFGARESVWRVALEPDFLSVFAPHALDFACCAFNFACSNRRITIFNSVVGSFVIRIGFYHCCSRVFFAGRSWNGCEVPVELCDVPGCSRNNAPPEW